MRELKWLVINLIVLSFFGCKCPTKIKKEFIEEREKEKKPEITSIIKPEVTPSTIDTKTPDETKPKKEEGKATYEEITAAIKEEEIPVTPIPTDVKFVKPEEIHPELKGIFENIYFDFDKYNIREDAAQTLKKIGDYLLKNPEIKILIEGHCDERGTREYNLVLGEQRALSARRFLIVMGVSPKRLYTVSYGEDMPADPRSNEEAWAKNRRCEFKIEVKK
ncbi:MAG: peptidoglycan-associated lipoprotein Pal [bacterium]|nr:peptidoglycan-associated lipoprotein Pal [bacterium]MCX7917212.1 peptidoglycan-associated lipoprotein Pal [bacterium]MDW8164338.1 peptidoglycan-associated lipoprotein Pal [Candidatus Omnitrophota bacterium]